jgi:hypothetical protein
MRKILALTSIALCALAGNSRAQVILQDSFTYPPILGDTTLTNVSGRLWTNYSGTIDSKVNNNRLEVFGNRAGDVYRPFTNTLSSSVAYASFIVNSTNLVNNTNYFAHFSANGTTFKGRVFAAGLGLAPNSWRLGVSAAAGTPSKIYPLDLATNVDYRVTLSYDTSSFAASIWVDSVAATDLNLTSSDSTTAATLGFFSFRQSGTTVSAPNLVVDDLYVGNAFADVNVGTTKPAVVYYQPNPAVIVFSGNSTNLYCVGAGSGALSFQWQHAGTNLVDDANTTGSASNVLSLVSTVVSQSGNYRCIVASITNGVAQNTATSAVSVVTVSQSPIPPTINGGPTSLTLYRGQSAVFSVTASGPGTITYQWKSNNVDIAGETAPTLTIPNVQTSISGSQYRCAATNQYGGVVSSNATLTVINPPHVSVAFLRSLVDPNNNYTATNSTQPYEVTGVITTYTNITTGNTSSYYLQDATAGINIFATFGSTFRPAQGDVVTFVGVTSSFSSGLELFADTVNRTYTSYTIVSNNYPVPAPLSIPFTVTNNNFSNMNYTIAGKVVQLTNVFFGASAGTAIASGFVTVTNGLGQSFNLWFSAADLDTVGQTLPDYAKTVTGVMFGSQNAGAPNFAVAVTKFSDIVTNLPVINPIPLNITVAGSSLTFNWTDASFTLQSATNLLGPWVDIVGATSPFVTNTTADPSVFYRLFHP